MRLTPEQMAVMTQEEVTDWNKVMGITVNQHTE